MVMLATLVALLLVVSAAAHLITHLLAARRYVRAVPHLGGQDLPFVTVIRPVCGVDRFDRETLGSTFELDYPAYEILFCAAHEADPAVALVKELMAAHPQRHARLLIGDTHLSGNPKLNNIVKGYSAANGAYVVMTDSNLLMPGEYLRELMACWENDVGLVSAPPIGTRPENFAASLECAFLNTHQGRWQLAADALGYGFAQGKTLFWRRQVLDGGGGLRMLGRDLAEDVASTKLVRAQGKRVRLAQRLYEQPVGSRTFGNVLGRQLRWSQIRREGFRNLFLLESLQGIWPAMMALLALAATGVLPLWLALPLFVLWYGVEWGLARLAGWPSAPRDLLAMIVRDALMPYIWLRSWHAKPPVWRGTAVTRFEPEFVD